MPKNIYFFKSNVFQYLTKIKKTKIDFCAINFVKRQKYIVCPDCGKGYRIGETTCPLCQINNKEKQKSNVRKKKKNVTEKKYGTILGLKGKITISDFHKAYRKKIKENHPDKVANMGKEIKALAQQQTKEINEAYKYFINKYKP